MFLSSDANWPGTWSPHYTLLLISWWTIQSVHSQCSPSGWSINTHVVDIKMKKYRIVDGDLIVLPRTLPLYRKWAVDGEGGKYHVTMLLRQRGWRRQRQIGWWEFEWRRNAEMHHVCPSVNKVQPMVKIYLASDWYIKLWLQVSWHCLSPIPQSDNHRVILTQRNRIHFSPCLSTVGVFKSKAASNKWLWDHIPALQWTAWPLNGFMDPPVMLLIFYEMPYNKIEAKRIQERRPQRHSLAYECWRLTFEAWRCGCGGAPRRRKSTAQYTI